MTLTGGEDTGSDNVIMISISTTAKEHTHLLHSNNINSVGSKALFNSLQDLVLKNVQILARSPFLVFFALDNFGQSLKDFLGQ